MKVENLVPHALCHLDNWLHEPARLTEVSNEQLELLGSVSILVAHLEQQRIAEESRLDTEGVAAGDAVPSVPVAECCAVFIADSMKEMMGLFTEDSEHPVLEKLRESHTLLAHYIAQQQAINGGSYPFGH